MTLLRRIWRLTLMALIVLAGIVITLVLWLPKRLRWINYDHILGIASLWFRCLLFAMGARVTVHGTLSSRPGMWISNHISWLDIMVIGSQARVHFVSKAEVRRWPVVGFLAAQTGTLFLRRGANESGEMAKLMSRRIKEGHGVLFFPEGTTGHGDYLRRFHPRLFAAAIELQQPIIPLAVRYESEPQPHPLVPYTKEQNLMSNLWSLLGLKRLRITLFAPTTINELGDQRRALADRCREVIRESLNLPAPALPPEQVLAERRAR
ncbi:MAG: lysophospholipid acyltransferase family protein [Natronospirillum sp.]